MAEREKKVVPDGGARGVAMRRRLERGVLTEEDERLIRWAEVIREGRTKRKTWGVIAGELGATARQVEQFEKRGVYRTVLAWLREREAQGDAATAKAVQQSHRGVIQKLVPKALRRLELALEAGEDGGVLVESKTADHAMDTVLEAAGLLEPEGGAVRPVIHIEQLVINQQLESLRADEARMVDVTP